MRRALGLMSGTSLDGIDVALIETDGRDRRRARAGADHRLSGRISASGCARSLGGVGPVAAVEAELTRLHAEAVDIFSRGTRRPRVDLVGFHGHTILHRPAERRTWQIGDGALLARLARDRRRRRFPLAPTSRRAARARRWRRCYHAALAAALPKPLAVLNLGGVANVTWIGEGDERQILAFDTGPGNALIDDWVRRHTGAAADFGGALARAGQACRRRMSRRFSRASYFARKPPKSLDRDDFRDAARRRPLARRRRRHPDRDDRGRGRRGAPRISRRRRASGWSPAAAGTTRR